MGKGRKQGKKSPNPAKPNRKPLKRKEVSSEEDFEQKLALLGLQVKEITGDGNCLFRALSDQVYGVDNRFAALRSAVVDYIRAHEEHFRWFVEDDESFDDYVTKMSCDGEWGGHPELFAASQLLGTEILVHQYDAPALRLGSSDGEEGSKSTLHLSYHGEMHYNSCVPLSEPQVPLTELLGGVDPLTADLGSADPDSRDGEEGTEEEEIPYEGDEAKVEALVENVRNTSRQDAIRALLSVDDDVVAAVDRLFELKKLKGPDGLVEVSQRQERKMRIIRRKVEKQYDKVERERIRRKAKAEKLQGIASSQPAEDTNSEAAVETAALRMAQTLDI